MRADHFRDKRIETANQFASRFIIVPQGSLNQLSRVEINHVAVENVSTLITMTAKGSERLLFSRGVLRAWSFPGAWGLGFGAFFCNRRARRAVTSYETVLTIEMNTNMKRNLITLAAVGVIALGGYAFAQGHGGWHGQGLAMGHLTKALNLTAEQQSKVQPLIDQARPQIVAIHKDAMDKTHAVIDKTMSQIRPILTSDQQKKFDDLQKARQDMRNAMQELHSAMKE